MVGMSTAPENLTASGATVPFLTSIATDSNPRQKRWTRQEYYELYEAGYFEGKRVELINGEILEMSPQSFEHSWSLDVVAEKLREVFGRDYWVRSQAPFPRDEWSEPEPDVLVSKGNRSSFTDHPTSAVLAVEVSKTSLHFDKSTKQSLYASMGVPDYWVLDLENRQLLVHRQPITDGETQFGHHYEQVDTIAEDGHVSPLEKPEAKLAVGEMLPPIKKS